jgi:hypothetical protein
VGLGGGGEGEHAIDHRLEHPALEQGDQVAGEEAGGGDLLFQRTGTEDGAEEAQAAAEDEAQVQLGAGPGEEAHQHQPSARGQAGQILGEVAAADQLEDDVHALAGGGAHLVRELAVSNDDPLVEAEGARLLELSRAAGAAQGAGADGAGDLHGRRAHPAPHGGDQHRLPGGEPGLGDHGIPGGDEGLRHGGPVHERHPRRHLHQHAGGHHDLLGVGAAAGEPEHPVARLQIGHSRPHQIDLSGQLHPRDVGGRIWRRGVTSHPLQQIGPVDRGGPDPHPQLSAGRLGRRHLAQLEHLRPAEAGDHHRLHCVGVPGGLMSSSSTSNTSGPAGAPPEGFSP